METPFSKKKITLSTRRYTCQEACTVADPIGLGARPMVSSKEDTQTPEIGQSGLSPTKNSSPTLANQNTSDSPLIHSTPASAISYNGANEEKHGCILSFQPLGGQLEYLENSSYPEGSPEPSPYPCAQALPEIHSTGPESTNQYLKSPNQEPVELALTLTPTNPEEAPSGRLPPWLRVPRPHPEQQTLGDFSNLAPSISRAGRNTHHTKPGHSYHPNITKITSTQCYP
ncbi:hypothetical protein PGTUg99_001118 [Puccinia graminis f. sp. tritici]|uniref:Uncharacterized protein n=1 Tax=Puccinia graminis f. sp. tritici TaxID=56615 RepID=A0A5B0PPM0_PUCGR|nr:hypothetical protein PGTUg99_001118 [Puccinia graminis f. sp. tritici]